MPITYYTENVFLPRRFKKRLLAKWIKDTGKQYEKITGDIAYIFCDDTKILEINQLYLKHDYYTDIITFDYTKNDVVAGDIFISLDMVRSNAEKFKTNFSDELYRVMIHGILHLCGIKDKTKIEQARMREAENKALEILSQAMKLAE